MSDSVIAEGFVVVPHWALTKRSLSMGARCTFAVLSGEGDTEFTPDVEELTRLLHRKVPTARGYLSELEAAHLMFWAPCTEAETCHECRAFGGHFWWSPSRTWAKAEVDVPDTVPEEWL